MIWLFHWFINRRLPSHEEITIRLRALRMRDAKDVAELEKLYAEST